MGHPLQCSEALYFDMYEGTVLKFLVWYENELGYVWGVLISHLLRSSDLRRGTVGRMKGTSSFRAWCFYSVGFAERECDCLDCDRYLSVEAPWFLRFTEVTRARRDLLLRSVVGRVEDEEASSSTAPTSASTSSTSRSSISSSLCVTVSRQASSAQYPDIVHLG